MMYKLIFATLLLFATTCNTYAQDPPARPDFPGSMLFDIGFSILDGTTNPQLDMNFWGSKQFNAYYLYDIRLGQSKFYFMPGFGVGLDKYRFDSDNLTLNVPVSNPEVTEIVDLAQGNLANASFQKSKIAANYFDIPLEFRFVLNPSDPRRSLRIGFGGKAGILFASHTKVKYEINDETVKVKDKRDFNLSPFRYGLNGRIGFGTFGLYFYYGLNELFEDGNAPMNDNGNQISFGLTINGF